MEDSNERVRGHLPARCIATAEATHAATNTTRDAFRLRPLYRWQLTKKRPTYPTCAGRLRSRRGPLPPVLEK